MCSNTEMTDVGVESSSTNQQVQNQNISPDFTMLDWASEVDPPCQPPTKLNPLAPEFIPGKACQQTTKLNPLAPEYIPGKAYTNPHNHQGFNSTAERRLAEQLTQFQNLSLKDLTTTCQSADLEFKEDRQAIPLNADTDQVRWVSYYPPVFGHEPTEPYSWLPKARSLRPSGRKCVLTTYMEPKGFSGDRRSI